MNRRNGTCSSDPILATYREYAPSPEFRGLVRAYFSFTAGASGSTNQSVTREVRFANGESFCSPLFADARASLIVRFGNTCDVRGVWRDGAHPDARVIGAQRSVGTEAITSHAEMIGVYFEPGAASYLLSVPGAEFTDRVVDLSAVRGTEGLRLAEELAELEEATRLERLEQALRAHLRADSTRHRTVDVIGLARYAQSNAPWMNVQRLADAAGLSRQHLTRLFTEIIGVSPKRFCRLARFHAGLAYAGAGASVQWAQVASDLGYADQSHMIAEFRELSSLTPDALAKGCWFHPFILDAKRAARSHARASADAHVSRL